MKKSIFLLAGIMCCLGVTAQISEGGTPPSFDYPSFLRSEQFDLNVITAVAEYDFEELRREDQLDREIAAPLRVAVPVTVSVDINETGTWSTLPDGTKIWQQTIELPNAEGAIISYEEFYIPEGAKLFIYNEDKSQVLGAYSNKNNPEGGRFSTENIYGEKFTLEYVQSSISDEEPRINIQQIGYIYDKIDIEDYNERNLRGYPPSPENGQDCMINVNCSEGSDWQKQKRGVVYIQMDFQHGWYACSGSLVNNTRNDGTPYVLSADHCFYKGQAAGYNPERETYYETTQFYFNYEYPTCENGTGIPSTTTSLIGSELRVRLPLDDKSDGVLVELTNQIPTTWNPYYNGWDVSNTPATSGVVIHHPANAVKKISTFTRTLESTFFSGTPYGSYWKVYYSATENGHSVTEQGSSGSPLFNQSGLIVGTLNGGESYCETVIPGASTNADVYGKLWYHYNQSPVLSQRMKTYLNPNESDITSLTGYDPNGGNSISTEEVTIDIKLFPNPVVDELYVNALGIIESVKVYDTFGRLIYNLKDAKSSTASLNVSDWTKGIYLFVVKTERGEFSEKIVKN